jgi:hypothetical protein
MVLARAGRQYQTQAALEAAEMSTEPNAPEVKLASWPMVRDERRLH